MSAHKFNPAKLAKLNHPDRYHRENPEAIWKTLNLADPRVIVDIGAGTGFFAIPFSRYMPEGVVYACDIADEMLEWLEKNLPAELQGRVIPVKMEERSVPLAAELADLVLMVNLHHELEDAAAILVEAWRLLKPGGKVAIVDWKDEATESGPPVEIRVSESRIRQQLSDAGFGALRMHRVLPCHHFLEARKPPNQPDNEGKD
ncbi:MAG: class I SAM-dependent methyltransferase [Desulfuromonadales bacterium]